ncbi:PKD domain-containing protein [Kitasatospora sp. NPDC049285]|uniref:PKD domain-containing protein n=1 Tax=Kitasatospora sp. NPDC049285 TaxID=3157096 RepID=UPI00341C9159
MRSRRVAAAALVALAAGSLPSVAGTATAAVTDLYVDRASAQCADDGPGSQEQPYCTVATAAAKVEPGQTVHLADYTYAERLEVTRSGTPQAPITFTGTSRGASPGSSARLTGITVRGASNVRIADLFVLGSSDEVVTVTGSSQVELNRLQVRRSDSTATAPAVHVTGRSTGVTVSQNIVSYGRLVVDQASTAVVSTNLIQTATAGITLDGARDTTVTSNTVGDGCGARLLVTGGSAGTVLENNVLLGTRATLPCPPEGQRDLEVSADSAPGTTAKYNSLLADATPYLWAGTAYDTAEAFRAATGQGAQDILKPTSEALNPTNIDSADALAPGELPVSLQNYHRTDDPAYANTGTGVGYYDRGASEVINPMTASLTDTSQHSPSDHPLDVTFSGSFTSPWSPATATVDFGDGTPAVPVTADSFPLSHRYPREGQFLATLTVTDSSGNQRRTYANLQLTAAPITAGLDVRHPAGADQLTVRTQPKDLSSPLPVVTYHYDFGDGTAAVEAATDAPVDHHYAKPGTYRVTTTVTDDHGRTGTAASPVTVGGAYVPLTTPQRVMDTRSGLGAPKAKVGPNGTVKLKVTGTAGVPDDGSVTAVLVNLTGTGASEPTHVIAYDGGQRPDTSNLNAVPGRDVGNASLVPVAPDGTITLYNHGGSLDLIADLQGYYSTGKVQPLGLYGVPAKRALDTRGSHPVGPDGTVTFKVRGPGLLPDNASVAVFNLTATGSDQDTYVTANPGKPVTHSSLNVSRGATVANQVTAPIDANGNVTLYNHVGTVQLIADLQGFYGTADGKAGPVIPITPARALDTRTGDKLAFDGRRTVNVREFGVPESATAVLVNLTGLDATEEGWMAVSSGDAYYWDSSNVNLTPGAIVPNLALVPVGNGGWITLYNHAGAADAILDIQGYTAS